MHDAHSAFPLMYQFEARRKRDNALPTLGESCYGDDDAQASSAGGHMAFCSGSRSNIRERKPSAPIDSKPERTGTFQS